VHKCGGDSLDRSASELGGSPANATPIDTLPSDELLIYELMIDDFTRDYRGAQAPIDAITDRLDLVQAPVGCGRRVHDRSKFL
jgi:hypothetical protein